MMPVAFQEQGIELPAPPRDVYLRRERGETGGIEKLRNKEFAVGTLRSAATAQCRQVERIHRIIGTDANNDPRARSVVKKKHGRSDKIRSYIGTSSCN